ncbi:MAG: hypothetical protein ACF8OB_03520, partial [Phycisphaeraceae bacterium JB051]
MLHGISFGLQSRVVATPPFFENLKNGWYISVQCLLAMNRKHIVFFLSEFPESDDELFDTLPVAAP